MPLPTRDSNDESHSFYRADTHSNALFVARERNFEKPRCIAHRCTCICTLETSKRLLFKTSSCDSTISCRLLTSYFNYAQLFLPLRVLIPAIYILIARTNNFCWIFYRRKTAYFWTVSLYYKVFYFHFFFSF